MQNVNGSSRTTSFIEKGKKLVWESGSYNLQKQFSSSKSWQKSEVCPATVDYPVGPHITVQQNFSNLKYFKHTLNFKHEVNRIKP